MSDYLHRNVNDLNPDVTSLVAGGMLRGRRLRRRRRIAATSLAAVAAVTVLGSGIAIAPRLLDSADPTQVGPADGRMSPSSSSPSSSPSPLQSQTTTTSPPPRERADDERQIGLSAEDLGTLVTGPFGGTATITDPSQTGGNADRVVSTFEWKGDAITLRAGNLEVAEERATADALCGPGQGVKVVCTQTDDGYTLARWTDGGTSGVPLTRGMTFVGPHWMLDIVDTSPGADTPTQLSFEQMSGVLTGDAWYR